MWQQMRTMLVVVLLLGSLASPWTLSGEAQEASPVAQADARGVFDGNVDIGGRTLHLSCQGAGSPTVILEAGQFPADAWAAVMRGVSEFTHVCAYDRANRDGSDPAPLPRSAEDVVADLHALLAAAQVPGPYVLVGASQGGLFTRLYAVTYPDDVAGMVLSDATFEEVFELQALLLTPEDAETALQADLGGSDEEGIWTTESLPITLAQVREARLAGLKPMPLVVLAAGNLEGDLGPDSPFPPASNAIWPTEYLLLQVTHATLTPNAKFSV
jgi:pimeloyl-ACP methyl ester carboxylesterase